VATCRSGFSQLSADMLCLRAPPDRIDHFPGDRFLRDGSLGAGLQRTYSVNGPCTREHMMRAEGAAPDDRVASVPSERAW